MVVVVRRSGSRVESVGNRRGRVERVGTGRGVGRVERVGTGRGVALGRRPFVVVVVVLGGVEAVFVATVAFLLLLQSRHWGDEYA